MEYLPKDPAILVSSVNMLLRDEEFDSLESLCYAFSRDPKEMFPMTLECRVKQKGGTRDVDNIVGGHLDESETGYYLVAEIVNILCDEKYLAEDGKPDVEKMKLITFDPVHHTYIQLGKTIGMLSLMANS